MHNTKTRILEDILEFAKYFDKSTNPKSEVLPTLNVKLLAKRSGFSAKKVRSILKKIRSDEAIKFEVFFDPAKLHLFRGMLEIKSKHPKFNSALTKQLSEIPFVIAIHELAGGDISHLISFCLPNSEYLSYWVETYFCHSLSKQLDFVRATTTYDLNENLINKPVNNKQKLDAVDWHILGLLKCDALRTLKELSAEVDLSLVAVYKRIRNLQKSGFVEGYVCNVDWDMLPSKYSPVRFVCKIKIDYPYLSNVAKVIASMDLVRAYRTLGETDFILLASRPALKEYRQLIKQLADLPGVIDVKTLFMTKTIRRRTSMLDIFKYYTNQL